MKIETPHGTIEIIDKQPNQAKQPINQTQPNETTSIDTTQQQLSQKRKKVVFSVSIHEDVANTLRTLRREGKIQKLNNWVEEALLEKLKFTLQQPTDNTEINQ